MLRELVKKYVPIDLWTEASSLAYNTIDRAKFWRQRGYIIERDEIAPFNIGYIGRSERLPHALDVLRLGEEGKATRLLGLANRLDPYTVLFFDGPFPGAWRVPGLLRTLVPLDRPIEEIMAGYEAELRRRLRRLIERSETRDITSTAEVLRINQQMLVPFALARHGERTHIMPEREILRMSREGKLRLVLLDGQPIGAYIGYSYERQGKRCWAASRFGYPEAVFSDRKLLSEANSLVAHSALLHAVSTGHEVFDFGMSNACPEGGLLQFKRRRGGHLSTFNCHVFFSFRPPRIGSDVFLWRSPLFSIEQGGLVLHLGVPEDVSDDEVLVRLKRLAYAGLDSVRLHSGRTLAPEMVALISHIFSSERGAVHGKGSARRIEIAEVRTGVV